MIDFTNYEIAFKDKNTADLKSAIFLFKMMKNPALVKIGKLGMEVAKLLNIPMGWLFKPTLYKHFIGGETLEKCIPTLERLSARKAYSVMDYAAEDGISEKQIEATFAETLHTIEFAASHKQIAYAVFKPSAFISHEALEHKAAGRELTPKEQREFDVFVKRIEKLALRAYELDVRLLIDAEHYSTQDVVDDLTYRLMKLYNKEKAIIFNTLQMYRNDRLKHLEEQYEIAQKNGYILGMKFVRGAYMDEERQRAKENGYPDPIWKTKQETDVCFDEGIRFCASRIEGCEIFCGTHNEVSTQSLVDIMFENKINSNDDRIFFAQLYGMSDNLTFNLSQNGYNTLKYIPYGPVMEVVPYLIRRAEENTMVKGQSLRELDMLRTEYQRRIALEQSCELVEQHNSVSS